MGLPANELRLGRASSQRLAHLGDAVRQRDLFHEAIGPNPFQKGIFFEEMTLVFNQQQECVERFRRQGNRLGLRPN